MILDIKLDGECVGDIDNYAGRNCGGEIAKDCLEAGENGGVCELLCVNKVLCYQSEVKK